MLVLKLLSKASLKLKVLFFIGIILLNLGVLLQLFALVIISSLPSIYLGESGSNPIVNYFYAIFDYENSAAFIIFILCALGISFLFVNFNRVIIGLFKLELSNEIFQRTLTEDYILIADTDSSEKVQNLTQELDKVTFFVLNPLQEMVNNLFITIYYLSLLILTIGLTNFLIGLPILLLILVFTLSIGVLTRISGNAITIKSQEKIKNITESLSLSIERRYLQINNFFAGRNQKIEKMLAFHQSRNQILGTLPRYLIEILLYASIILAVSNIPIDSDAFSSNIILLGLIAIRLIPTINGFVKSINIISAQNISLNRILNIYTKTVEKPTKKLDFKENIRYENLVFSYEKEKFIYPNIELIKGNKYLIKGPSGSGKTTLIKAISGLYTIDAKIYIDNELITNSKDLRSLFALCPQTPNILNENLLTNIFFNNDVTKDDISSLENYLSLFKLDHLKEFIYLSDYYLGERGEKLSGGEQQRLSIIRSLLSKKEMLVLDEPIAALAKEDGDDLLNKIFELEKTIIIVSHQEINKEFDQIFNL